MPNPLKLIISGPVGAGKTTFITKLSETCVVNTDELATEDIGKAETTIAMDFGTLMLDGMPIHLFGTPGQERFDFMWEILCEGALGMVLLVAGNRPQDFSRARNILEFIYSRIPIPFVMGVTHQDLPKVWEPEEVADYFGIGYQQVMGINATDRDSSRQLLIKLLTYIDHYENL